MRPFFLNCIGIATRGIFLYAHPLYFAAYAAYKRRTDRTKLALIRTLVRPGDCVVDVGAHIGFTTRFLATQVGAGGRVIACEPSPENYQFLQRNTCAYQNVETVPAAAWSSPGALPLFLSRTLNVDHRTYASAESRRTVAVAATTLDVLLSDRPPVAFIKLDVQGSELAVLRGAHQVLGRSRPHIVSELWPWGLSQAGSSTSALLDLLDSAGYDTLLIDEASGRLCPLDQTALAEERSVYYDIYCRPRT